MNDRPIIDEVWPDKPPVCAGCGNEVQVEFCSTTDDGRLYCGMCVARQKREAKEAERVPNGA